MKNGILFCAAICALLLLAGCMTKTANQAGNAEPAAGGQGANQTQAGNQTATAEPEPDMGLFRHGAAFRLPELHHPGA